MEPTAVLFGYDSKTGQHTADPFVGVGWADPITMAYALRERIEDDFPGWLWAVTGNDEANELGRDALVNATSRPNPTKPRRW
jgi:hypothetical protein